MIRPRLNEALTEAIKAKEKRAVSTLRLILACLKDRDIAAFQKQIRRGKAAAKHRLTVLRRGEEGFAEIPVTVTLEEAPLTESEVPDYHDEVFTVHVPDKINY